MVEDGEAGVGVMVDDAVAVESDIGTVLESGS